MISRHTLRHPKSHLVANRMVVS